MNVLRWTLALALLTTSLTPTAVTDHLSVGGQDSLGLQRTENARTPSVDQATWERGTQHPCTEPAGDPATATAELQAVTTADPLCGRLVYHPGTVFAQTSPPDQTYPLGRFEANGTVYHALEFDVVLTHYVGTFGAWSCLPWCLDGPGTTGYMLAHDALYEAGLSEDDGQGTWQRDRGAQTYNVDLHLPHAVMVAEAATGTGYLDGWRPATGDLSFIGFLDGARDTGWEPIGADQLEAIVASLQRQGRLPEATQARVCGFNPVFNLSAPGTWHPGCEVSFRWVGPTGDEPGPDEPRSPCRSPTYVCGTHQPAWHAKAVCGVGTGTCRLPEEAMDPSADGRVPLQRRADPGDPRPPRHADSTTAHRIWHFVAAPTPSGCNGAQEPGFEPWTYLAHDLDIHTPPGQDRHAQNLDGLQAWSAAAAGRQQGHALDLWEATVPPVWADDQVEPNAQPVGRWADTAREHVRVDRSNTSACLTLPGTPETADTVDPWVDLLDARTEQIAVEALLDGAISLPQDPLELAASDGERDASNQAGPAWLRSRGKVGVFTDRDDDGRYDQAPRDRLWDAVGSVGAYPLFWDLWLDESGQVDPRAGCHPLDPSGPTAGLTGHPASSSLSTMMAHAGYGPRTGLVQAVYLRMPTVLVHLPSTTVVGPVEGDQIHLFMSQGVRSLYADGDPHEGDPWIVDTIDGLLAALKTHAVETGSPDPPPVVQPLRAVPGDPPPPPRADLGQVVVEADGLERTWSNQTDLSPQCDEPTGGFTSDWAFLHACPTPEACRGATIITLYLYEDGPHNPLTLTTDDPGTWIEPFAPHGEVIGLEPGTNVWVDVDPLDGDPSRNR